MTIANVGGGMAVTYEIEHRNGKCEKCGIPFQYFETGEIDEATNTPVTVRRCPKCGANVGQLIYREASVMFPELPEAPPEPTCFTVECIKAYQKKFDAWTEKCKELVDFYKLLSQYHSARCKYCEEHRNDEIEEKYRTGEPSPETEEEAKKEITKLRR